MSKEDKCRYSSVFSFGLTFTVGMLTIKFMLIKTNQSMVEELSLVATLMEEGNVNDW